MRGLHINLALVVVLASVTFLGGCGNPDSDLEGGGSAPETTVQSESQTAEPILQPTAELSAAATAVRPIEPIATVTAEQPVLTAENPEENLPPLSSPDDVPGVPAIEPRRANVDRFTPTFDIADVKAYLDATPFKYQDREQPPPVVEFIEFLPAGIASERIQTKIYRDNDALVCMVILKGHFVKQGPGVLQYGGSTAFLVFDAYTGYLLVLGIMP